MCSQKRNNPNLKLKSENQTKLTCIFLLSLQLIKNIREIKQSTIIINPPTINIKLISTKK
jgi:hypothetical protein